MSVDMVGSGRFRIVNVVNRTTTMREAQWDGIPYEIPAGYKFDEAGHIVGAGENGKPLSFAMPYFAAEAAKRQNPVPGTLDPEYHLDYEMYIAVIEFGDDIGYREPSEAIELLDRSLLPEDRQNVTHRYVPGSGRGARNKGRRRELYSKLLSGNPNGARGEYPGGAVFER